jgi:hypothetical protein
MGTRHVAVDGLLNGWVSRGGIVNFRADYRPAWLIEAAFRVTLLGVVVSVALGLLILAKRLRHGRIGSPHDH